MNTIVVTQGYGYDYTKADFVYAIRRRDLEKGFDALPRRIREKPVDVDLEKFLRVQKICVLTSADGFEELETLVTAHDIMAQV